LVARTFYAFAQYLSQGSEQSAPMNNCESGDRPNCVRWIVVTAEVLASQQAPVFLSRRGVACGDRLHGESTVKTTRSLAQCLAVYFTAILIVACTNQMEPAKNALDNINATLAAASADAQTYIPDQLAGAQSKVAALKASFDNKDYAAVVAGAPAVLTEVSGLAGAASAKKDETLKALGNEWRNLAATIPQSVAAVQTRVDALSKTKHVPKGVDLAAAKSGLGDATAVWEKAKSDFNSGNASDAVSAAKDAKSKLDSAASALKLDLPQAT
jgi:hypothetical protein